MKAIQFLAAGILFLSITNNADAQVKEWLKQKKEEAKQKANAKLDQKTSEGIDKTVNTPETVIKKKAEKKKNKKNATEEGQQQSNSGGEPVNDNTVKTNSSSPIEVKNEAPDENGHTVIQTNIKCKEGKAKVTAALKKLKAITTTDLNTATGELTIKYNTDAISYTQIITTITDNGFEADGNAPTNTKANPCN